MKNIPRETSQTGKVKNPVISLWHIEPKAIHEQTRQTKTHSYGQQHDGYQRERWVGRVVQGVKGVKYMEMDKDLSLAGGHTMLYTNDVS